MLAKLVIGLILGIIAGGTLGYVVRYLATSSPRHAPYSGAALGALLGVVVAFSLSGGDIRARQGQEAYDELPVVSTEEDFQSQVRTSHPVLVDFTIQGCVYCRDLAPTLGLLSKEFQGRARFLRVDADLAPSLAQRYQVDAFPTVIILQTGQEPVRMVGVRPPGEYRQILSAGAPQSRPTVESKNTSDMITHAGQLTAPATTKGVAMTQATAVARFVTMKGQPIELVGTPLKVGDKAPDFTVVSTDLQEVRFYDLSSKVFVLSAVPSLDTPVCDRETHRFNQEAGKLGPDVKILTISMDLPFAQKRWCAAGDVKNVTTLSDYRYASFGSAYGVLMKDLRLEARCVFVVDANRKITFIQLVPDISGEPNYDQVLQAVRDVLGR